MAVVLGTGFIILIVVWIICILLCLVFSRCEGSAAYVGIVCILVAIIVTLVLWFYPRDVPADKTYVAYDNTSVLRVAVVSLLGVMLLVGGVVVVLFHVFDEHRATALKPWTYQ